MHIKNIHCMIEKMAEYCKCDIEKGYERLDLKTTGPAIDILKDLCEAEYYARIAKAMEKEEEEEKLEQEVGRMFYPRRRNSRGQFMGGGRRGYDEPPYMHMPDMRDIRIMDGMSGYEGWEPDRDMDILKGRMYYAGDRQGTGREWSGNGQRSQVQGSESRYGFSHDEYLEKRKSLNPMQPEDKRKREELLDGYLEDLCDMSKEVVDGMTPEEKQKWKSKITKILNM